MGRSFRRWLFIVLPLLLIAGAAGADQASLLPPASTVELRSYGFGLLPLDGKFTRFHGWMRYDPANPGACQVVLELEAGSLAMANDSIRERITGPEMMDVARFPTLLSLLHFSLAFWPVRKRVPGEFQFQVEWRDFRFRLPRRPDRLNV